MPLDLEDSFQWGQVELDLALEITGLQTGLVIPYDDEMKQFIRIQVKSGDGREFNITDCVRTDFDKYEFALENTFETNICFKVPSNFTIKNKPMPKKGLVLFIDKCDDKHKCQVTA